MALQGLVNLVLHRVKKQRLRNCELDQDEDPCQTCCVLYRKSSVVRYVGRDALNQHA